MRIYSFFQLSVYNGLKSHTYWGYMLICRFCLVDMQTISVQNKR